MASFLEKKTCYPMVKMVPLKEKVNLTSNEFKFWSEEQML